MRVPFLLNLLLMLYLLQATQQLEVIEDMNVELEATENDEDAAAMSEILEMQRREAEEQRLLEEDELVRVAEAAAAEREAAAKERESSLGGSRSSSSSRGQVKDKDDWISRSRPGAKAKPGAGLKAATSASEAAAASVNEERRDRDHVIQSRTGNKAEYMPFGSKNIDSASKKTAREKVTIAKGPDIEGKLSPEILARQQKAEAMKEDQGAVVKARVDRFKVARRYARPVEKILKAFEKLPVDYYGVLEVDEDEDEISLKRKYRQVTLAVHPDKNPHPDAKLAFDKLQEAYSVLSSRERRDSYDKGMMNRRKKRWHRVKKSIRDYLHNLKSRLQLFVARVKKHEFTEELSEISASYHDVKERVRVTIEKIYYAPDLLDKALVVMDMIKGHKPMLIASILAISALSPG